MTRYRVMVTVPKGALGNTIHGGVTVFAVARLGNGTRLSARLYFDAEAIDLRERTAKLLFPGKPGFADEHVELELGEQVELLAGDQVVLTCRVIA